MSYRDDTDALLHRASALQAEVHRLQEELAQRPPRPTWPAYREQEAAAARAERREPPALSRPARAAPPPMPRPWASGDAPDDPLAMLDDLRESAPAPAAPPELTAVLDCLTREERDLVRRLVDLLAGDAGGGAVAHHRLAVFDRVVGELRARLAGPD